MPLGQLADWHVLAAQLPQLTVPPQPSLNVPHSPGAQVVFVCVQQSPVVALQTSPMGQLVELQMQSPPDSRDCGEQTGVVAGQVTSQLPQLPSSFVSTHAPPQQRP